MGQKGKILLTKVFNNNFWKNNIILKSNNLYKKNYYQFTIAQKIIDFFFYSPITQYLNKKNTLVKRNLYISQISINNINNFILISFSIKYRFKKIRKYKNYDNYIRLKYSIPCLIKKKKF